MKDATDEAIDGSSNVFAALDVPDPEQELTKARLCFEIFEIFKDRGLTQVEASKILGIQQSQAALLMLNRPGSFSVGRLIDFLTALGRDVEITVMPTRKEHGSALIVLA